MVSREIFLRRSWVWWIPLLFVVVAALGIAFYQLAFAGETAVLERRLETRADQLDQLRESRRQIESFLERARAQSDAAGILYRDHFSTEEQRFTRIMREVRDLAARSRLSPPSFSYPGTEIEDHGLVRRNINFGVEGTYDQLRTFINFLELTDQFLTLESVNLGGGAAERDPNLKIRLSLATYFVRDPMEIGIDDTSFGSSVDDREDPSGESEDSGETRGGDENGDAEGEAMESESNGTEAIEKVDEGEITSHPVLPSANEEEATR